MGAIEDIDAELAASNSEAPKPHRPKAAPAPTGGAGVDPATFAQYMADPSPLLKNKGLGANSPLSADQIKQVRGAWPILNVPMTQQRPEERAKSAQLMQHVDTLLGSGEQLYGAPLQRGVADKVAEHFRWETQQNKDAGSFFGPGSDPVLKLKGKAREQAVAAVGLIARMQDRQAGTGEEGKASPYTLILTTLPQQGDSPEVINQKRREFAKQVGNLAEQYPSNEAETAIKHIVRARHLAAGTQPTIGPAPGATAPAPEEDTGMGAGEAIGRGLLHGATGLSAAGIAALAHGMTRRGGFEAPIGEGLTQEIPDEEASPENVTFKGANETVQGLVQDPAKLEQAHEEHPVLSRGGEFVGGFAEPSNAMLGPFMAAKGLAPAAKILLRSATGAATAGAAEAGETGEAPSVRTLLVGAGLGSMLGGVADKILDSPATASVIKKIVNQFSSDTRATSPEVAAKLAAVQEAAQGSTEGRAVTAGVPKALEEEGPRLVDARNALLAKHGVKPGSSIANSVDAVEEAIDRGDVKAAEAARRALRAKFGKDAEEMDRLFTQREVLAAAHATHAPHGGSGGTSHPLAQLASGQASTPEVLAAAARETGEGRGKVAAGAYLAGKLRTAMGPIRSGQQAIARLWYARETGDIGMFKEAAVQGARLGLPVTTIRQLAGPLADKLQDWGVLQ